MTFLLWAARSAPLGAQPWWCPGLGSTLVLTLSYPTGGPGGQGSGGMQEDADDSKKIRGGIGLVFLMLAWGAFCGDLHIICKAAQAGSGTQGKQRKASYISSVACSGARILVPSFSLLQKSSSIWTPG